MKQDAVSVTSGADGFIAYTYMRNISVGYGTDGTSKKPLV